MPAKEMGWSGEREERGFGACKVGGRGRLSRLRLGFPRVLPLGLPFFVILPPKMDVQSRTVR